MRNHSKKYSILLIGTLILVFFQNCGQYDARNSGSPLVYKIGDGQLIESSQLSLSAKRDVCEAVNNWQCTVRHFRPNVTNATGTAFVCAEDFCVSAIEVTLDTSAALAACEGCTPSDGQMGGRYHYDEVDCGNDKITQDQQYVITASSERSERALAEAYTLCLLKAE